MAVTTLDLLRWRHVNELQSFLKARASKFKTLQKLAAEMRVTFSGFLRGVKQGTLSVENCLLLAEQLGEEPPAVLRVAQKGAVANLIERLYGKQKHARLTGKQRWLIAAYESASQRDRDIVDVVLRGESTSEFMGTEITEEQQAEADRREIEMAARRAKKRAQNSR